MAVDIAYSVGHRHRLSIISLLVAVGKAFAMNIDTGASKGRWVVSTGIFDHIRSYIDLS